MGLTHIKVNIANPAKPRQALELSFLVDSGAVYSVVPAALLRKLRIRPHSKRTFILADGSEITRKIVSAEWPSGRGPGHFWRKAGQHPARHHLSQGPWNDARSHEARTPPLTHAPGLAH